MAKRINWRSEGPDADIECVALLGSTTAEEMKKALADAPGVLRSVKSSEIRIRAGAATFCAIGAVPMTRADARLLVRPPQLSPPAVLNHLAQILRLPTVGRRRSGIWWLSTALHLPVVQFKNMNPERWIPRLLCLTDAEYSPGIDVRGSIGERPNAADIQVDFIRGCIWIHGSWRGAKEMRSFVEGMITRLEELRKRMR